MLSPLRYSNVTPLSFVKVVDFVLVKVVSCSFLWSFLHGTWRIVSELIIFLFLIFSACVPATIYLMKTRDEVSSVLD